MQRMRTTKGDQLAYFAYVLSSHLAQHADVVFQHKLFVFPLSFPLSFVRVHVHHLVSVP